jgi:hypothetical protein
MKPREMYEKCNVLHSGCENRRIFVVAGVVLAL